MKLSLINRILSDYRTHHRDLHSPGFQALAVQRLGHWAIHQPNPLVRMPVRQVHKYLERRVRRQHGIELHENTCIGDKVRIDHQSGIVIHGNAVIGDNVTIRQNVTIGAKDESQVHRFMAPKIGNNVSIGCGAVILGAVTVGRGAKIGANAVVTKDVPAEAVMVGAPAESVEDRKQLLLWNRGLVYRAMKRDADAEPKPQEEVIN